MLEGQQAVHKENGTQFPKPCFLGTQKNELSLSIQVKGIRQHMGVRVSVRRTEFVLHCSLVPL